MCWLRFLCLAALPLAAADYAAPAGNRPAIRRPGAATILPGGRVIVPLGQQHRTGPGPFGLAVSADGKTVVTVNNGPEKFSLSILENRPNAPGMMRHIALHRLSPGEQADESAEDWRSVFMGVAFAGNRTAYIAEGNSGRVRLVDLASGARRKVYELNQDGFEDSFAGDLALDTERGLLYVVDQANFRLVTIDVRKHRIAASLRLGRLPFAIALSPDARKVYVTHIGMFEYQALPGADRSKASSTGLPFPAFGFPSAEARDGVRRETERGPVDVRGLGDPNANESNSLYVVDVADASAPRIAAVVRTGLPFGGASFAGSSPAGVVATADRVFVANSHNDSITVIDAKTNQIIADIPLRIAGLETLRGVLPIGMAYDAPSARLLVAEAGINAVGIIDTKTARVIGHVPAGWFPTKVVIDRDMVYVGNAKGQGTGPSLRQRGLELGDDPFIDVLHQGSISIFPMPGTEELPTQTATVMEANGFRPRRDAAPALPSTIKYVVIIVKENHTFDEMLGDITAAANGAVAGLPVLARYGRRGYADGRHKRLSVLGINVTPNHHSLAERWSFGDNFYADSEVSLDGHHWLVGAYPDVWTESSRMAHFAGEKDFRFATKAPGRLLFAGTNSSVHPEEQPEAGTLWHHLERHGIPFRNFGEGFELAGIAEDQHFKPTGARLLTNAPMPDPLYRNTSRQYPGFNINIPDQYRASQFIQEIEEKYVKGGEPLPRLLFIYLPNDYAAEPRPDGGYPFPASFVADNDYALGRIVEFLSHTPWWREMAVFVTEAGAQGGRDHIDSHRTVMIAAGPYIKRGYVSHTNSSFPGLLKTVFRLLGVPPLNLFDAAASDLSDIFTQTPDFAAYDLLPEDTRLFNPAAAQ